MLIVDGDNTLSLQRSSIVRGARCEPRNYSEGLCSPKLLLCQARNKLILGNLYAYESNAVTLVPS
jgi:hypothetical protein